MRIDSDQGLLAFTDRASAPGDWHTENVRSPQDMARVIRAVAGTMAGFGYPKRDVFGMQLALEEAIVNAVEHGHKGDGLKRVRVSYLVTAGQTLAEVEDWGGTYPNPPGHPFYGVHGSGEVFAFHPGGANVLFGDGSVHFVRADVDIRVFAKLVTREGKELPSDDY